MIKTIGIIALGLLFLTSPVYAAEPPILISPANNSTILTIPTFSWQTVSGSTGYNILIDDEPTVTSPYAKTPYYPTNPSYSPQTLNPGTYYWKVKAKNSSGNWDSFSSIWSFTLASSTITPAPSTTPAPTPSPTPTPTQSPTGSSSSSSFSISNSPSQITSDQSFNISVNLSLPNNPNTLFYLKGAFKKADGSNYFGQTLVSNNWVKNGNSYSSQYPITTDSSGNWSGNLEVRADKEDSGFTGSSDYIFKVARYTSSGLGPTWSNESSINIIQSNMSTNQGTTNQQTTTNNSPPSNSESLTPSPNFLQKTTLNKSTSVPKFNYQVASIAAATASATPSDKLEVKNQKQINPLLLVGISLVFAGASSLGYIYLKRR